MAPCAVLLVLAVLAKYNNMIYLAAFVIMLIVHAIKNISRGIKNNNQNDKKTDSKKVKNPALVLGISSVAFALVLCIAAVGSINLVIESYKSRSKADLADGLSQVQYLDMGLSDSYMAPGWYTRVGLETYLEANLDNKAADKTSWQHIDVKLDKMGRDMGYAFDFFSKKILSQWNEPEFESIWVSKVKGHTNSQLASQGIAKAVYDGSLGQALEIHFNLYMQIVYLLFAVGIYLMFINKKTNIETILLPLVVLGGFGYHLLFEGKSQYVLTYIPLLLPTAAYALNTILEGDYSKIKSVVAKINKKVEHN